MTLFEYEEDAATNKKVSHSHVCFKLLQCYSFFIFVRAGRFKNTVAAYWCLELFYVFVSRMLKYIAMFELCFSRFWKLKWYC